MPNFKGIPSASPSQRGYGQVHRLSRARAFRVLPDYSPCVRCGKTMWKWAKDKQGKSALHYDHTDGREGYLGFSHRACNVKAGASKGARIANAKKCLTVPRRWTL